MTDWSLDSAAPVTVSGVVAGAVLMAGTKEELSAQEEDSRELEGHEQKPHVTLHAIPYINLESWGYSK